MIKREAKSGVLFRHWLKANPQFDCSYEMKDTRGKDYLNFSAVKDNQISYAQAIQSDKGTLIRVQGTNGEPDYVYLRSAPAYIVLKYPKSFQIIKIREFLLEKSSSERKSLTEARAKHIAVISVKL